MSSAPLKVLLAASEAEPFARTGGLGDVVGALARALHEEGLSVCLMLPLYAGIRGRFRLVSTAIRFRIPLDGPRVEEGRLWRLADETPGPETYFVENPGFFRREGLYGEGGRDYPDNVSRFVFFSRAVLEGARRLGLRPDLVHLHDWQTALVPLYLRTLYRRDFGGTRSVFTIHNLGYQGIFWHLDMPILGLGWEYFHMEALEFHGRINLLKAGLVFSDALTTVSPTYAREIQTPEQGFGLDGVLRKRARDLAGIRNGIDTAHWNPAADPRIERPFDSARPGGKRDCKAALRKELGLRRSPRTPLAGVVSRLTEQKGMDLLLGVSRTLFERRDLQLALLGTGDPGLERALGRLALRYPGRVAVRIGFDDDLARRIYAGADLFLMPSRYEPCGLSQMIAMRYGAIPVVRRTGGLADTVREGSRRGNGFVFRPPSGRALLRAVDRALDLWKTPPAWKALRRRAMTEDFSWTGPARAYRDLYTRLRRGSGGQGR